MFTFSKIAQIVDGDLVGQRKGSCPLRVIHNSRLVREGDLFVALTGSRTDGHNHVSDALANGATGAIVSERSAIPKSMDNAVVVDDTLIALHKLASAWRNQLDAQFVGITGTCGKTTTKALVGHLLGVGREVFVAPANYNTEIGLPLALLETPKSAQVGVFELGASVPGDIELLVKLLLPDIGIITTVGRGHLDKFGSINEVAREKWELIRGLDEQGVGIVNADCSPLEKLASSWGGKIRTFGLRSGEVHGRVQHTCEGIVVDTTNPAASFSAPLLGEHNASNLLGAIVCAVEFGMNVDQISSRLKSFKPVPHRLSLVSTSFGYVIDDTYNSNPDSASAALRTLVEADLPATTRSFVFGDMLGLGKQTPEYHDEVLKLALSLGIEPIFPVGEQATAAGRRANSDLGSRVVFAEENKLVASIVDKLVGKQNVLLVKGSRDLGLEHLVEELISLAD